MRTTCMPSPQRHTFHHQEEYDIRPYAGLARKRKTVKIQNLNSKEIKNIKSISFLASGEQVKWKQDESGLYITTPSQPIGEYAYAFKVITK